jgi:hypothetical protein
MKTAPTVSKTRWYLQRYRILSDQEGDAIPVYYALQKYHLGDLEQEDKTTGGFVLVEVDDAGEPVSTRRLLRCAVCGKWHGRRGPRCSCRLSQDTP